MKETPLAFPYSKAFLDLSVEENRLEEAYLDMKRISKVGDENADLKGILNNPLLSFQKKGKSY